MHRPNKIKDGIMQGQSSLQNIQISTSKDSQMDLNCKNTKLIWSLSILYPDLKMTKTVKKTGVFQGNYRTVQA
jgi:hypothetical protein